MRIINKWVLSALFPMTEQTRHPSSCSCSCCSQRALGRCDAQQTILDSLDRVRRFLPFQSAARSGECSFFSFAVGLARLRMHRVRWVFMCVFGDHSGIDGPRKRNRAWYMNTGKYGRAYRHRPFILLHIVCYTQTQTKRHAIKTASKRTCKVHVCRSGYHHRSPSSGRFHHFMRYFIIIHPNKAYERRAFIIYVIITNLIFSFVFSALHNVAQLLDVWRPTSRI